MDIAAMKEQFSKAYVRAVAAVAGFSGYEPEVDDDSVDWETSGKVPTSAPWGDAG